VDMYLNKGVREVIEEFPDVGEILENYQIGCVECTAAECLLKDVVEIHNQPPDQEEQMMNEITAVIYPDRKPETRVGKKGGRPEKKKIKYSPPMKRLVEEHNLIKRWVALIPKVVDNMDFEPEDYKNIVREGVNFIRKYADGYHHAKEEEILFAYFDENLDILKTMHVDHENARAHVKAIVAGLKSNDAQAIREHLSAYGDLLPEHIKKEDEILYPWMDRNLSTKQVGELFYKFDSVEKEFGDTPQKCEEFIRKLEEKFCKGGT